MSGPAAYRYEVTETADGLQASSVDVDGWRDTLTCSWAADGVVVWIETDHARGGDRNGLRLARDTAGELADHLRGDPRADSSVAAEFEASAPAVGCDNLVVHRRADGGFIFWLARDGDAGRSLADLTLGPEPTQAIARYLRRGTS